MSPQVRHQKITRTTTMTELANTLNNQLMTHAEMCEALRISEQTGYYWRQVRKGPKGARIGKQLLYRCADVNAWVDAQFNA